MTFPKLCILTTLISLMAILIGIVKCAIRFGANTKVSNEDRKTIIKTYLIAMVPGWNLVRSIRFAINPFKYIHGIK